MDTEVKSQAQAEALDDGRLVELGLKGDRDAFGQLVSRYQSPVCALAYSACGNLAQSEDLAQETFIVAWRSLGGLKEPAKFKAWLFGIARNLIHNAFRRQTRNPLATAEMLDERTEAPATVGNPAGQAISKEEEEILWRSLENIPEAYREPLILFYREHQSIEKVAATLDLSEEAARQRLSRGRKLLQEQVMSFVEGALLETAPGTAFTLSVVSALPGLTAAAGSSAAGGAAGKVIVTVGFFAAIKSLLAKVAPPIFSVWAMYTTAESKREKMFVIKSMAGLFFGSFIIFPGILMLVGYAGGRYWDVHPHAFTVFMLCATFGFIAFIGPYTFWMARKQRRIQREEAKGRPFSMSQSYEYRSAYTFLGLPLVHVRWHCMKDGKTLPAVGWIACGNKAFGILFATGQYAVGMISCGAVAIGIIGLGGFGFGAFAFGGTALGILAMGGASIGYMAFGGGAIGWLGATGGAALARYYATGGGAIAEHANDHVAYAFIDSNPFFRNVYHIFFVLILFSWIVPSGTRLIFKWRRERSSRAAQVTQ